MQAPGLFASLGVLLVALTQVSPGPAPASETGPDRSFVAGESQSPWLHRNYITQDERPTTRPSPVNTFDLERNQAPNAPAQQQQQQRRP